MEFTAPCYHETIEGTVPEKFTNSQKAGEAERQRSNTECLKIGPSANFFLARLTEATGVPRTHALKKNSQYFPPARELNAPTSQSFYSDSFYTNAL